MNKWDDRYLSAKQSGSACSLLEQNLHLLPQQGKALDLACGLGGNALLLQAQGLEVEAWDSSAAALQKLSEFTVDKPITTRCIDLEAETPPLQQFDVIVIAHYLYRPLSHWIISSLAPGGLLFYQTYHDQKLTEQGPSSPQFLLKPGELLSLFNGLQLVLYREEGACGNLNLGERNLAMMVAQKPPM